MAKKNIFQRLIPFKKKQTIRLTETEDRPEKVRMLKFGQQGSTGTDLVSGVLNEDYLDAITGTKGADIYDKMRRSDTRVKMCIQAVMNPIKSAEWDIQTQSDDPKDQAMADFCKYVIFEDMDKRWKRLLHEILTMVVFGYSAFERVHKVTKGHPKWGNFIGYKNFAFRSQRTIEYWNVNDCEELKSVTQFAFGDGQKTTVEIDANFLTVFSLDQEGNNFEGVSLLRPCYGAWLRKQTYLKLIAIGVEGFAKPTPIAKVPSNIPPDDAQFLNLISVLESYVSHQSQYITIPEGWDIDFNTTNFDASKVQSSVTHENGEIVDGFLANFLDLGKGGGGSYALSFDLSDFFLGGIEHIADHVCEVFNDEIIPEIIDLNFGKQEKYPEMKCSGISDRLGQEFSTLLKALADSKYIIPDDDLEDHLRKRIGLPKRSDQGQRETESQSNSIFGLREPKESITLADSPSTKIKKGTESVQEIMSKHLNLMGKKLVAKILTRINKLSPSQYSSVIGDVDLGIPSEYREELQEAIAKIGADALAQARKEVPAKKDVRLSDASESVKLAEFESLPRKVQKDIKKRSQLLLGTQLEDLKKAVFFTLANSVTKVQSPASLEADLNETVRDKTKQTSLLAAASSTSAFVVNSARNSFFYDDEVLEEIYAFKFVNGDPISPICQNLAGRVFSKDDPTARDYQPPLHFNCKSFIIPILERVKNKPEISPLGLKPTSETAAKSINLDEGGGDE